MRWGKKGQVRGVLVYSNCDRAELFLNGVSQGERVRDSQNFPAAGLRWNVAFVPGGNHLRVEAHKAGAIVSDEIKLIYETEPWGHATALRLAASARDGDRVTVEAKLFDAKSKVCLDARQAVRFSLTGHGRLIDNRGTVRGSRVVQLANGRAEISLDAKGACSVCAAIEGLPPREAGCAVVNRLSIYRDRQKRRLTQAERLV